MGGVGGQWDLKDKERAAAREGGMQAMTPIRFPTPKNTASRPNTNLTNYIMP